MLTIDEINKLFDYSTESKDNDIDKREKNERRFRTIIMRVNEVLQAIYDSKKGVIESIQIVNERYSSILNETDVFNVIKEIKTLYEVISSISLNANINNIAYEIISFDFTQYEKVLNICKISGLKSILRLANMKKLAQKYINGIVNEKYYRKDIEKQEEFFKDLLLKYKDISTENFYVYVLRYDLKTITKKSRI
jgi:hypothetical protein